MAAEHEQADNKAAGPAVDDFQLLNSSANNESDQQSADQQLAAARHFAASGHQASGLTGAGNTGNNDPLIAQFWSDQLAQVQQEEALDFKTHPLPLARIKKVMKMDAEIRSLMISSELPVLLGKACEIFVLELTMRAWSVTEQNKRRTLQKNDVSSAIGKCDTFDFLIDIVPRDSSIHATAARRYPMAEEYQRAFGLTAGASGAVASGNGGAAAQNGGALMLHPEYLYQQLYNSAAGGVASAADPNALLAYQQQLQQQYLQQQQQLSQLQSQQFQQQPDEHNEAGQDDMGSSVIVSPQDDQFQNASNSTTQGQK